jgi:hypothetical protein
MKTLKLITALMIAGAVFSRFVSPVVAQTTAEQNQSQEVEVVCEVGAYGQAVNCRVRTTQEQDQRIATEKMVVYRDGRVVPVHKAVDTGVEAPIALAAGLMMTIGAASVFARSKK